MTKTKRRTVLMGAWVLAVLVIALLLWWYLAKGPVTGEQAYFRYLPKLSRTSAARIPSGFPIYYVLGASPEVTKGSQAVNPNSNVRVYHVETTVSSDPRTVFDEYVQFFTKTEWLIRAQYLGSTAGSITAEKGDETVVVTFTPFKRTTHVTIQYQTPTTAQ